MYVNNWYEIFLWIWGIIIGMEFIIAYEMLDSTENIICPKFTVIGLNTRFLFIEYFAIMDIYFYVIFLQNRRLLVNWIFTVILP